MWTIASLDLEGESALPQLLSSVLSTMNGPADTASLNMSPDERKIEPTKSNGRAAHFPIITVSDLWKPILAGRLVLERRPDQEIRGLDTSRIPNPRSDGKGHRLWRLKLIKLYLGDKNTINPRLSSRFIPIWDVVTFFATIMTAIVTPFEVAFVEDAQCVDGLFLFNRIIDLLFLIDIVIIFHLQYLDDTTGLWVTSRRKIAWQYVKTWFFFDLISIVPIYVLLFLDANATCYPFVHDPITTEVGSGLGGSRYAERQAALSVRTIRLLRLVKLARVLKSARLFTSLITDLLVKYFEVTYAMTEVAKLTIMIISIAHLSACTWNFVPSLFVDDHSESPTWKRAMREDKGQAFDSPFETYVAALYWATMTLTGIGYGDISPQNTPEQVVAVVLMLVTASAWASVIGTIAGVYSTLNPTLVQHRNTMDTLNYFMRERQLPKDLRIMLREYFQNARHMLEGNNDEDLLAKMSPLLKGTVAIAANSIWLAQIWFLNGLGLTRLERDFVASLAMQLQLAAFIVDERMPIGQLYVLRRGMVVKLYRFLGKGRVWGEDALLPHANFAIVDHSQAVALTFCECMVLRRHDFVRVGTAFPDEMAKIRKRMRQIVLQRYLILSLARVSNGACACRSFIRREDAQGFTYLESWRTEPDEIGYSTTRSRSSPRLSRRNRLSPKLSRGPSEDRDQDRDQDRDGARGGRSSRVDGEWGGGVFAPCGPRDAASLDGIVRDGAFAPHAAHGTLEETTSQLVDVLRDMQTAQIRMDAQLQLFGQRLEALRAATPVDVNVQVLPDGAVRHAREMTS